MAASFISALVIKHNLDVYMNTGSLTAGVTMPIPTIGAGGVPDGDFWATPITDNIVDGFNFYPLDANNQNTAPTAQSFRVFRLVERLGNDSWYVRGTTTSATSGSPASCGYIQASNDAECCAVSPCHLPTDIPVFAPCQTMCEWNANNLYFAEFALPVLTANFRYYPYGYFNNVLLPAGVSTGYATKTALLAFLNSGTWGTIGTWSFDATVNANSIGVVQSAGPGTDVVCVNFITVNPSA